MCMRTEILKPEIKQEVSVCKERKAYPLNTPKTRFSTKKEPKITRLTKYTHGSSKPIASFIWRKRRHQRGRKAVGREEEKSELSG